VALKDNIALAGVQCTNGTGAVNWVPQVDATLVTRILDSGGIIAGKAACENNCFGAVRYVSANPPTIRQELTKPAIHLSPAQSITPMRTATVQVARLPAQHVSSPPEKSTLQ
jgi:hypothetical protein